MGLVKFMSSGTGRALRVALGIVLIVLGLAVVQGTAGIVLVVVGFTPIVAGVFDFCLLGALFGVPLSGNAARAKLASH
jgi:hypothetical protein